LFSDLWEVNLEKKIDQLFSKIDIMTKEMSVIRKENVALKKENFQLKKRVSFLENKLYKKNSTNSSIPPSKDENRVKPNQSLREKTGKEIGGQKGSKGTTLKMHAVVDHIVDHKLYFCSCCGDQLYGDQELLGKRQVVDIPPIKPIVTEHRIYSSICQCGKNNVSQYPKEASAPISYGNSVEAAIGYLSVGQYMSMQRIAEFFEQVFNIKLSQGTISNKLASLTKQCMPMYEHIQARIESSKVIGADETGCVVNGKKWWMWTWQNASLTYIAASNNRGYQAILDNFPDGLPSTILVSDCWAAQLKTRTLLKQICLAHIQRDLKFFIQSCKNRWSVRFLKLIYKALELKRLILHDVSINHEIKVKKIKKDSEALLNQMAKGPKKLQALKKRLGKNAPSLWTFLDHINVPPDNNGAERAIRNVKVKQKVSGQFRSEKGAQQFAIIRSVYDTIRKNNGKAFDALSLVANYVPE
jgi:regulator of replication initiation timing/transposase